MGEVPASRLRPEEPFGCLFVDLMGPFGVSMNGRKGSKAYVVVFTCGTYHAVAFEVIFGLAADDFLLALVRFNSRHPHGIKQMFSDNGSNFVKANKDLTAAMEAWKKKDLQNTSVSGMKLEGITWSFGIPNTGWSMGKVERIVGLAKNLLFTMLSRDTLQVEILRTVLAQIELVLNNRPITKVSNDPNDFSALRPLDFIYPKVPDFPSSQVLPEGEMDPKMRWSMVQTLTKKFADRWKQEYISTLLPRSKWKTAKASLKKDDLVVLQDSGLHRDQWRLGRVTGVKNPNSVQVRGVLVRMPDGKVLERHHNSLVRLELDS